MRWHIPDSPKLPKLKSYRVGIWLLLLVGLLITSLLILYQLKSIGVATIKLNEIANGLFILNIVALFAFTFWLIFLYLFNRSIAKSTLLINQEKLAIQRWAEHKTALLAFSYYNFGDYDSGDYDCGDLESGLSDAALENKPKAANTERVTSVELIKKLLVDLSLSRFQAESEQCVEVIFISDNLQQPDDQIRFESLLSQLNLQHIKVKQFRVINQNLTSFFAEHYCQNNVQHTLLFMISGSCLDNQSSDNQAAQQTAKQSLKHINQNNYIDNSNQPNLFESETLINSPFFAAAFWFYNGLEQSSTSIKPIGLIPRIITTTDKDLSADLSHLSQLQKPAVLPTNIDFSGVTQEMKTGYLLALYEANYLPQDHVIQQADIQSLNDFGQFNDWHVFAKFIFEKFGRTEFVADETEVLTDYQLTDHQILVLQLDENIVNISIYSTSENKRTKE